MTWAHWAYFLNYLAEVLMWLVVGAVAGLVVGEGIGLLRRRKWLRTRPATRNRR